MGFHYPAHIRFDLSVTLDAGSLLTGYVLDLFESVRTTGVPISADIYLILMVPGGEQYYGMDWGEMLQPAMTDYLFPENLDIKDQLIWSILIPSDSPPIGESGEYTFSIYATKPETMDVISNVGTVNFKIE